MLQDLSLIVSRHSIVRWLVDRVPLRGGEVGLLRVGGEGEEVTYFDLLLELLIKF